MAIVQTNINYTYESMIKNILELRFLYPFLRIENLGYSVLGKSIPVIKLGQGSNEVFYSGSYHANEWITTTILMKFIEDYCFSYSNNLTLFGYSIRDLFAYTTIYIMPMVNPDGVDLVTGFYPPNSGIYNSFQNIANRYPRNSFSYWLESKF